MLDQSFMAFMAFNFIGMPPLDKLEMVAHAVRTVHVCCCFCNLLHCHAGYNSGTSNPLTSLAEQYLMRCWLPSLEQREAAQQQNI
jgi:hypothetical protein